MTSDLHTGIHARVPFDDYLAIDAASKHGLDLVNRNPYDYYANKVNPKPPNDAMSLGTAFHTLLLEPEEFDKRYVIDPTAGKQTKAAKEERAEIEASGVLLLKQRKDPHYWSPDDWDLLHRAVDSARSSPLVEALLTAGESETTYLWTDPETGLLCKARPDWRDWNHNLMIDAKFTRDIEPEAFARSAARFRYHVQAAFYTWAAHEVETPIDAFLFLCVQSSPPYRVELYQLDSVALHAGYKTFRTDLDTFAKCRESGDWPNGGRTIHTLSLPRWAL